MALARFGAAIEQRERNRIALAEEMQSQQRASDRKRRLGFLFLAACLGGVGYYVQQKVFLPDIPEVKPPAIAKAKQSKNEIDQREKDQLDALDAAVDPEAPPVPRTVSANPSSLDKLEKLASHLPQPGSGGPAAPEFDPELGQMPGNTSPPPEEQAAAPNRDPSVPARPSDLEKLEKLASQLPQSGSGGPAAPEFDPELGQMPGNTSPSRGPASLPDSKMANLPNGEGALPESAPAPERKPASNPVLMGNYQIRQQPDWEMKPSVSPPPAPDAYEHVRLNIPAKYFADRSEFSDLN